MNHLLDLCLNSNLGSFKSLEKIQEVLYTCPDDSIPMIH